jgi:hypothetical protein
MPCQTLRGAIEWALGIPSNEGAAASSASSTRGPHPLAADAKD